jgi:UDP-galactopyranose mutase
MVRVLPSQFVNFTHTGPYTRIVEWKNWPEHGDNPHYTTLSYEEPCDYRDNNMERYYPVKDVSGKNRDTYKKYRDLVGDHMTFIGRCGQYVYIDMHQAIASSLATAKQFLKEQQ